MPRQAPTADDLWIRVDRYLFEALTPAADPALDAALAASEAADLPAINVSANQGKLLMILARAIGARRILEIGTLGGYSTIWLARALPPDGRLVTLEIDAAHAAVARRNIEAARASDRVDIRVAPALQSLPALADEPPFDFIFIDADKESNADYFRWAVRLGRPGTMIVIDNVVRRGGVADPASADASVLGVRRMNEAIAAEPRVTASAMQTVGSKGYDGLCIALITGE